MIIHYLKIAWRNLWKYKTQSAICIVGLAVGFVCFALSALWIHYETTYDSSYEGADRMYLVYKKDILSKSGYSIGLPYSVSTWLKRDMPDVEATCAFSWGAKGILVGENGRKIEGGDLQADSCFMNLFGLSVLKGNYDFLSVKDKIALTEEYAMQLFGSTDVLGRKVKLNERMELSVCAVVEGSGEHTSFPFSYWYNHIDPVWHDQCAYNVCMVVIKLREGVSLEAFQQKFDRYVGRLTEKQGKAVLEGCRFIPLSRYHYASFNEERTIRFNYLVLFAGVGLLVILSSLFNYLMLFVSRMRMREREIELRKACGSSRMRLFLLFMTEYLLVIVFAGLVGMVLIELLLPLFRNVSGVTGGVYASSLAYFMGILLVSALCLFPFIRYRERGYIRRLDVFRKASVFFQLLVSMLFICCVSVLLKQVIHLRHADIGWERKNLAVFDYMYPQDDFEQIAKRVGQLSYTQVLLKGHLGLFHAQMRMASSIDDWEGKQDSDASVNIEFIPEGETFMRFYGLKLQEGDYPKAGANEIVLNESAVRALGIHKIVGKSVHMTNKWCTVTGIVKDFHTTAPTVPVNPIALTGEAHEAEIDGIRVVYSGDCLAVRYHEGKGEELQAYVDRMMAEDYPDVRYRLTDIEEAYDRYLQSEYLLLKLLVFVSVVCMVVSLFGIYSLVTLACRQRRKEIAVRKINGATVSDILLIFVKEYFLLLTSAALVAFLIGYILMKHWLEQYVEQTEISVWLFLLIYIGMALVVCLSIGSRVWEAVRQNPAEVIKEMN